MHEALGVCGGSHGPGVLGQLGVLPSHVLIPPLLDIGALSFVPSKAGSTRVLAVGGGYLEVERDRVVVITDSAEFKEDIDAERARKALDSLDAGDAQCDLLTERRKLGGTAAEGPVARRA